MHEKILLLPMNSIVFCLFIVLMILSGCELLSRHDQSDQEDGSIIVPEYYYVIAPDDRLNIFVWKNPDVSVTGIPVRPDGRISSPLVEDMVASGKTPTQLANDIEQVLAEVIKNPLVTVTVVQFVGGFNQQVRVVGEAVAPSALPYRNNMTLLDVMITVGGLTEFAAGNKASIVRNFNGIEKHFKVRLEDLLKGGDISANVNVFPGDILIIPESLF